MAGGDHGPDTLAGGVRIVHTLVRDCNVICRRRATSPPRRLFDAERRRRVCNGLAPDSHSHRQVPPQRRVCNRFGSRLA
ncbi:hypothetical protein P168DRAFT_288129 [Aspergillus campestris IBT 28561]|uniref:Uncharacterized protein n=1 Tax=Aspergillus campestris (strain IBT 28561) TaxID=1392248 RepID=A0A2I1D8I6_ASPC2|nr:uncharacterized protein P168DRAFT_288129 [Aspergillus campestris IBT 28561]PKY06167.1 hypothetical protein P168DRAFT_288129 [Aspergillus campestris IBT 28561]